MSRLRALLTLARWLGPWADAAAVPDGVARAEVTVPGHRPLRVWRVGPADRASIGVLFVVPGLHYEGPADPRFWRFLAILARAGITVWAPFLPDFLALQVRRRVVADVERAFAALLAEPWLPAGARPGVFSISFGGCLAARLACTSPDADRVAGLLMFGSPGDFGRALDFVLTGEEPGLPGAPWDPVNQPVAYLNLLDGLPDGPDDPTALAEAWRGFARATWGQPERKTDDMRVRVADELAATLPEAQRALFRLGCGVEGDTVGVGRAVARAVAGQFDWVDPRPHLASARCPVTLVHGVDDDVIPVTHLSDLAEAVASGQLRWALTTGLYGHTGTPDLRELLALAPAAVRELWGMTRILRAIVGTASDGVSGPFRA